jgi:hypothetical protein
MNLAKLIGAVSLAFVLATVPGCGKKDKDDNAGEANTPKARGTQPSAAGKVELKASLDGVIRGKVVLEGDMPAIAQVATMAAHTDHDRCLAGEDFEKIEQKWIIGKDKGVANVVIFLRAPQGKYFPIKDEDKHRSDEVVVRQPHCAYVPHVSAAFPSYFDGKGQTRTGQTFVVENNATFNHNTSWKGDPIKTGVGNRNLKAGDKLPIELQPEANPIALACDVHSWMTAKVWAFDHPYFAVTKMDGTFEFKNAPTGVEVGLVAWHEAAGYFHGGKEGTKMKFNPGDNRVDLNIKAK